MRNKTNLCPGTQIPRSWGIPAAHLALATFLCFVVQAPNALGEKPHSTEEATPEPTTVAGATIAGATVAEILDRMDAQMTFENRSSMARMLIITPEGTREKKFRSFSRGEQDSLLVFEKPAREKGTKFLKIAGQLWIYFPRTEKTVKIAGHLLRQSMLGSDFSYEDLTENRSVLEDYTGTLQEEEELDGEPCYVIHLQEKMRGMSYPERRYWISKKTNLPLREERYAKNGRLLKIATFTDVRQFGESHYPTRFIMEDTLKEGSRTEIILDELHFSIPEPDGVFDKRNLRRDIRF